MTSALCDQAQTDSSQAAFLLWNLDNELYQQEGQSHTQDVRTPGARMMWVQRRGSKGRDKKGGGGMHP